MVFHFLLHNCLCVRVCVHRLRVVVSKTESPSLSSVRNRGHYEEETFPLACEVCGKRFRVSNARLSGVEFRLLNC